MNNELIFIGEIRTPYTKISECPTNIFSNENPSTIELYDTYAIGISGLEKGQEIIVLYWLDKIEGDERRVEITTSINGGKAYGTFGLRTPYRPNPIGLAIIKIVDITENSIIVHGLDCLDGTKLLDIKPVI